MKVNWYNVKRLLRYEMMAFYVVVLVSAYAKLRGIV